MFYVVPEHKNFTLNGSKLALKNGHSPEEAVVQAVMTMEASPTFNAGVGMIHEDRLLSSMYKICSKPEKEFDVHLRN